MIKDFVTRKQRLESNLDKFHNILKRDAIYLALFMTIVIFYVIFITSNLGV